ncbi:hypothetical protein [Streptomyces sp. NBC_00582]|uniref:hypothetical protein n=1 Tax=Streptomyces sp. NBC_00582 TaxID=2975783 RepID=UPI002E82490A|nr:hypothetical protein [Streptomyces sp. NBC_00582]WUB64440.1 hypothetical protein OG852_30630 [Streptomyces sp. NBC_00582]
MRRTSIAILATACLALAACSASGDSDDKPKAPASSATSSAPTLSAAEARQACVEAWAETIASRPDDFNAETDEDVEPSACKGLPEGDYTDMYFEGLQQANKQGREDLQACIDDPASCPTP